MSLAESIAKKKKKADEEELKKKIASITTEIKGK